MADKITSIAGLKREVKKLHNRNQRYATEPFEHEIIDAIAKFEASVKERLKELESFKTEFRGWTKRTFGDEELRRVLGKDGRNSVCESVCE